MAYSRKLQLFFKNKGLKQKEVAEILGVAPAMISRFWSGTSVFDADFIQNLVRHFPEIDLKYIFSEEDEDSVPIANEPPTPYILKDAEIINELELMEERIKKIRTSLAQKSHEK